MKYTLVPHPTERAEWLIVSEEHIKPKQWVYDIVKCGILYTDDSNNISSAYRKLVASTKLIDSSIPLIRREQSDCANIKQFSAYDLLLVLREGFNCVADNLDYMNGYGAYNVNKACEARTKYVDSLTESIYKEEYSIELELESYYISYDSCRMQSMRPKVDEEGYINIISTRQL